MDGLTFVSNLVGAILSWPVAAVVIALVLRKEIGRVIERLAHLKLPGGIEATIREELETAKDRIVEIVVESPTPSPTRIESDGANGGGQVRYLPQTATSASLDHYEKLIEVSPNAAILEAWTELEDEIRSTMISRGLADEKTPIARLVSKIDERLTLPIGSLSMVRNQVAHARRAKPITEEEARSFVYIAKSIIKTMRMKQMYSHLYKVGKPVCSKRDADRGRRGIVVGHDPDLDYRVKWENAEEPEAGVPQAAIEVKHRLSVGTKVVNTSTGERGVIAALDNLGSTTDGPYYKVDYEGKGVHGMIEESDLKEQ